MISLFLTNHTHLLCTLIGFFQWIPPLWRYITFSFSLLTALLTLIRKELMQEMWKKSTSAMIILFLTKHAHLLCTLICFFEWIPPLWWQLTLSSLLLMAWWMLIREELMQEMWKKSTSVMISLFLTNHIHLLRTLICFIEWIPPHWWCLIFLPVQLNTSLMQIG